MYTLYFTLLHASSLYKLLCLLFWIAGKYAWYLRYANHPFYVSVIRCSESSISIFGKCLGRQLHYVAMISQLYLHPNRYGVVLVGLMFATIICMLHMWVCD